MMFDAHARLIQRELNRLSKKSSREQKALVYFLLRNSLKHDTLSLGVESTCDGLDANWEKVLDDYINKVQDKI